MLSSSLTSGRRQSARPATRSCRAHRSASSHAIPLPLSRFVHIRPVAASVTVPSPLSENRFQP